MKIFEMVFESFSRTPLLFSETKTRGGVMTDFAKIAQPENQGDLASPKFNKADVTGAHSEPRENFDSKDIALTPNLGETAWCVCVCFACFHTQH